MSQFAAVDAVIAALITVIDAAVSVEVFDGIEISGAPLNQFVIVGNDASPDANPAEPAARVEQEWGTFERGSREEHGEVMGATVAQAGDDDLPSRRAETLAIMTAIEAALRANENLGGVVAIGGISSIDLHQERNDRGSLVRRVWTYSYTAYQG